jgi:hypothetical protein
MTKKPKPKPATPDEQIVMDKLARAMVPDAWKEYDEGNGVCTNMAGWACIESIKYAQKLIRAFPDIVSVIHQKEPFNPVMQAFALELPSGKLIRVDAESEGDALEWADRCSRQVYKSCRLATEDDVFEYMISKYVVAAPLPLRLVG